MFVVPDLDEVVAVAARLGIHLGADEAELYRKGLVAQLEQFDEFVQWRVTEHRPPVVSAAREPGHRPTPEEDPLNAWMWKCHITGADEGLLTGKTVSFKDHTAVAGIPLTFGSFAMEGFVPDFDATIVTRVLDAGGTVVGKNVMDGFSGGFGFGGGIGDYGRARNPHNPDHLTGGSSTGSAAALAAGEVDISFGGDQGGSIRIPAALCGIVGLKPTFGLVSHFGVAFGSEQSVDFTGPMARTVEDVAAALDAVAGFDGLDPRQGRDVPERVDTSSALGHGVTGVRIGVVDEGFDGADDDVRELVLAAVDVLGAGGAAVSNVSIPRHLDANRAAMALGPEGARAIFETGLFGAFAKTYYPADLVAAVNAMWATHADVLAPRNKLSLLVAEFSRRNFGGRVYAKAHNMRPTFVKAYDDALAEVDVLVMPTCLVKAPKYERPDGHLARVEENLATPTARTLARNTKPFNYTGHPALAMPCGKSDGLPVSFQLVGRAFDDAQLLRVAYAYEHLVDWGEIVGLG